MARDGGHSGNPLIVVADGDGASRTHRMAVLSEAFPDAHVFGVGDGGRAWNAARDGEASILLVAAGLDGASELVHRMVCHGAAARTQVVLVGGEPEGSPTDGFGADDRVFFPAPDAEVVCRVRALLQRRSVRDLEERVRELEAINGRHSQFLSLVSHEIRTPLSAVLSAATILMRYGRERPESVERFARVIHDEGRRLTRLINDLLDLQKIESGQASWSSGPHAVKDLLEEARESFAALSGERMVNLEVRVDSDPGPVTFDRDKIMQVVTNLLSNAVKYSPEGGRIFLRCDSDDSWLQIEVEDEGDGIPAGAEERIFDRFQQLTAADDRRGSGLGLTISRQLVERHGGTIEAVTGRTRGAQFVVRLPLAGRLDDDGPVR